MMHSTVLPTSTFPELLTFPSNNSKPSINNKNSKGNDSSHALRNLSLCQKQTAQTKSNLKFEPLKWQSSGLCKCGRRHFLGPTIATTLLNSFPSFALDPNSASMDTLEKIRPRKPDWYEQLYASLLNNCTKAYEAEVASYKSDLFSQLKGQAKEILEIGIGTGPNLKYYASEDGVRVVGVDPNRKMEKYARKAAEAAGLSSESFEFVHAVGEILPLKDDSVDAVIGTLVLCSVKDVDRTLKEVKRVLKPGGLYLFVEHVAAKDRTPLRFIQNILDPLQQLLADNCHITRETERLITEAGFSNVNSSRTSISNAFIVSPHIYGLAYK